MMRALPICGTAAAIAVIVILALGVARMTSDLAPDFVVQQAARWIVETPKAQRPRPTVVELRERFPLDPVGACAAIRLANLIRTGGADADGS